MMTREAKTGLLLGLIFIVAISIVLKDVNQSRLPGASEFDQPIPETSRGLDDILAAVEKLHPVEYNIKRAEPKPQKVVEVKVMRNQVFAEREAIQIEFPEEPVKEFGVVIPPDAPKATVYEVKQGDDLSGIAFAVYGPAEGNRWVNVSRIFNANRDVLPSMDVVQIGQMLEIPPLPSSGIAVAAGGHKESPLDSVAKQLSKASWKKSSPPVRFYRVKEGDSLWRIAQNRLGDGNRYREILRLNKGKIANEDDVSVDMELRLPAK